MCCITTDRRKMLNKGIARNGTIAKYVSTPFVLQWPSPVVGDRTSGIICAQAPSENIVLPLVP